MKAVAAMGCARHPFAQQALPSIRPVLKPMCMYITLSFFAVVFLVIGIITTLNLSTLKTYSVRYDNQCALDAVDCQVELQVDAKMQGELVLFYKLTNFRQNQRRYVEGKSTDQLQGVYVSYSGLSSLTPYRAVDDKEDAILLPSGLAPASFCTDTYAMDGITFSETGIAWPADVDMYKPFSTEYGTNGVEWMENLTEFPGGHMNEHFLVWMRFGSQPTLIKKFGICKDCTLNAGKHTIRINNSYPTTGFLGEKWVGVYENTRFGPRNTFFGGLAFAYAVLWLLGILMTVLIQLLRPRKDGDWRKVSKRIMKISGRE